MTISALNNDNRDAWNTFVESTENGTFFHLAQWQDVLQRAFGFKTHYHCTETAGKITGILPLALVKRPIFGPALISTPLSVYGGGLGNCAELEENAAKKANTMGVEYLELRAAEKPRRDWQVSERFFTFKRALSGDAEENLKSIPRKQRAEVRKGIAANLEVRFDQDIDLFYRIYSASVRNLGTPVFPKKYLRVLLGVFGDAVEITSILHDGKPLSSVLSFKYKDQILPYYGGGLPEARAHSAYPFMYWKVMERAGERGIRTFDFGRSMADSGAYAFKKNFGFEPKPLHYQYHLVKARQLPDMDPDNPRNKLLTSAWKKLPLPIANRLGPILYPVVV